MIHDISIYFVKTSHKKTLLTQTRMMHLFYEDLNFIEINSIDADINKFIHNHSLFLQIWFWISDQDNNVLKWLKQFREQLSKRIEQNERWLTRSADVLTLIMTWWIIFTIVLQLLFALSFNSIDIDADMTFLTDEISISLFSYLFFLSVRLILMQQILWSRSFNSLFTKTSHLLKTFLLHWHQWECLRFWDCWK